MTVYEGNHKKPIVILVHGLGMEQNIWTDPCSARILGGALPITVLLSEKPAHRDKVMSKITAGDRPDPKNLRTIFHDLRDKGYSVITWSQQRPAGPVDSAVKELTEVMDYAGKVHKGDIVLVCHSRGGLIARKFLADSNSNVSALITICTPHRGSYIAKLASYISPLVRIMTPFISENTNTSTLKKAVTRVTDFMKSNAVKELLPASDFFQTLSDRKKEGMRCLTLGGTQPRLFGFYKWTWKTAEGKRLICPEEVLSFPCSIEKIMPSLLFPDELKKGLGDGLVTAESSRLDWADEHRNFPLNHAQMIYDKRVREIIIRFIEEKA